jgi:hypothetical protein
MAKLAEHKNIGEWRGVGPDGRARGGGRTRPPSGLRREAFGQRAHRQRLDRPEPDLPAARVRRSFSRPPFIMTEAQMDEMFTKLGRALDKVFAEVV